MAMCDCDMHGRGQRAHCRRCCLTFSGPSAFDKHITVSGGHVAPSERGLVETQPGIWGWPSSGRIFEWLGREGAS